MVQLQTFDNELKIRNNLQKLSGIIEQEKKSLEDYIRDNPDYNKNYWPNKIEILFESYQLFKNLFEQSLIHDHEISAFNQKVKKLTDKTDATQRCLNIAYELLHLTIYIKTSTPPAPLEQQILKRGKEASWL